jgi:hypothetical protein
MTEDAWSFIPGPTGDEPFSLYRRYVQAIAFANYRLDISRGLKVIPQLATQRIYVHPHSVGKWVS